MVTIDRNAAAREMMMNPSRWPFRGFLCLTHGRECECGLPKLGCLPDGRLLGQIDVQPVVILANVGDITRENFASWPRQQYESFDALLADWQID